jgi:hypothetical protein
MFIDTVDHLLQQFPYSGSGHLVEAIVFLAQAGVGDRPLPLRGKVRGNKTEQLLP